MAAKNTFLEATVVRRSTIDLKKESPISDRRIIEIAKHTLLHCPSPFNVQSARVVVLLHDHHDRLWDLAYEHNQKVAPPQVFESKLGPNLKAYKAGYGTMLFYDDPKAVDKMPPFLSNVIKGFPEWSEHSNGMAQYIAWTALCAEGLGANLQHYQTGMTEKIAAEWNIPSDWVCRAQLVFGAPNGAPRGGVVKQFAPVEPRLQVFV